jgi:nucleoside-triphosphatase THEP1
LLGSNAENHDGMQEHEMNNQLIFLLTGERSAGKSTLCHELAKTLQRQGIDVAGLLTTQPTSHTLDVREIRGSACYRLTYPFESEKGIALTHFRINPEAMQRSTHTLETSFPTEVFILDELGPLELVRKQGWVDVLEMLAVEAYRVACLVVRPTLLGEAVRQLPGDVFTVVYITHANRDTLLPRLQEQILAQVKSS